jgi:hypothetical protein
MIPHATIEELLGMVFSERSLLRCYKQDSLEQRESVKRKLGGWCEMAAILGVIRSNELNRGVLARGNNMSAEAEESQLLKSVTKKRLVKAN